MIIDAKNLHYRILNEQIRESIKNNEDQFELNNVNGQRYIGCGIRKNIHIKINGTPGNDLGAFMDGPDIVINANAQDGVGNTMNNGKIIIDGNCGDVSGYAMRGGRIFIKGDIGYRAGIHMKSYNEQIPVIIAGGCAGDFFGEYMAGGILILLGLENETSNQSSDADSIVGNYIGTGMHGGSIYIRGEISDYQYGKEINIIELTKEDEGILKEHLSDYCMDFKLNLNKILKKEFVKLTPKSARPYKKLYCH